ncbi:MAG: pyridoxal-phosphate dependent enzyme [Chloroflexi bacterium]|nr:pyridoxal-phosphate dependent enzyme [Chloroflexota bacterium]
MVDQIGNTPLLRLVNADVPAAVSLYAKLEFFNPGGSVKDRPARRMILEGLASGDLDLELYDGAGTLVGSSWSVTRAAARRTSPSPSPTRSSSGARRSSSRSCPTCSTTCATPSAPIPA